MVAFVSPAIGRSLETARHAGQANNLGPDRLRRGPEATTDRAGGDASSVIKASSASRQRQRTSRGRLTVSGAARDLRGSASPSVRRRTPDRVCMTAVRELHAVVEALPPSAKPVASFDRGYARERGRRVGVADRGSIPRRSTKSPAAWVIAAMRSSSAHYSQVRRGGTRAALGPVAVEAKERLAARPARVVGASGRRGVTSPRRCVRYRSQFTQNSKQEGAPGVLAVESAVDSPTTAKAIAIRSAVVPGNLPHAGRCRVPAILKRPRGTSSTVPMPGALSGNGAPPDLALRAKRGHGLSLPSGARGPANSSAARWGVLSMEVI